MKLLLLVIPFLLLGISQASAIGIQIDHSNDWIKLSNGTIAPYSLTQDTSIISLETKQGSYVFNKNTCLLSFYNNTSIQGSPAIPYDSYTLKANLDGTGTWNPVNSINNAACSTSIITSPDSITISSTKSVAGSGVFQINYTKKDSMPVKISFKAINQNPSWTNYHIGMTETIAVPRYVTLGNQTLDLSLYNNTSLSRTWLLNHKAEVFKLGNNLHYNTGLGWNNVNDVLILYRNNQASLSVDYTYNTPILQPNQSILIDPSITMDTSATTSGTSSATSFTLGVTVGNNAHRILVVGSTLLSISAGGETTSSVKIGSTPFTEVSQKSDTSGDESSFWYLVNPPTGAQTITITPSSHSGNYAYITGVYSLYNVNTVSPIGTNSSAKGTSGTVSVSITPTHTGAWIIDDVAGYSNLGGSLSAPTFTQKWNLVPAGGFNGASQYSSSPTIGGANNMQWTLGSPTSWASSALELKPYSGPSTPTLLKVNTINSTAINATWTNTSAAWYQLNYTSPNGGTMTQYANTTSLFKLVTGLTPGTQYQFTVSAGNSSGISSGSATKSNYTTNIAPTSLAASQITKTTARVTWINPSGNFSGFKIEKQPAGGSWSTVVSNTLNSTNHRDLSGLTEGLGYGIRISTNYATGSNYSGTSSPSLILNFTTNTSTTGTVTTATQIVGDAIRVNGTTSILTGEPTPVTLKSMRLYVNGTLYQSAAINQNITVGSSYTYSNFWYQFANANNQTFKLAASVTNFTGLASETQITINSTSVSQHRDYPPDYFTARTPSLGLVNYTISRSVPTSILLSANRDVGGITFPMECLYQTASQAMTGGNTGTWVNKTSIGFWYQNQPVSASQVYYITCYDPNEELFHTSSLVNGSYTLFGITGFDNTFGAFLGLPVGVFFLVMAASLGNRRTSPMWVVIILAIAGMMATIGFFTLDQNIWYMAIIAGLLGLFVGRKLF